MAKITVYIANRLWLVLCIYIFSLMLAAFLFVLVEDHSYGEGLWWAAVTSLTIGYGDISPVSNAGRIIGVLFGHFWIFAVIPMVVANIIIRLMEDKNKFTDEEQKELIARIKRIEKMLIEDKKHND